MKEWRELTSDVWILNLVQGFKLDFLVEPIQKFVPFPYKLSALEHVAASENVREFLELGILREVLPVENQWISNIFLRPKPDGNFRVIFDMSEWNKLN